MKATNQDYLEHLFLSQALTRLIDGSRTYNMSLQQLQQVMKGANQFNPKMLAERERMQKELEKIDHDIQKLMPVVRETGLNLMDECREKYGMGEFEFLVDPPKLAVSE